jgi:Mg2+ and Co2+ transporter CorA
MTKEFEEQVKKAVQKPTIDFPGVPKGASPPVFVKIDRYKDLLEDIQKLRSYSLGLRDAIDAMADIEKEFKTAMNLTNKVLDKVNILVSSIDMKLLQKHGSSAVLSTIKPPEDVENYVKGIYDQIEKLKTELKSLS